MTFESSSSVLNTNSLSLFLLGLSMGLIITLMGAGGALVAVPVTVILLDYNLDLVTTVSTLIVRTGAISRLALRRETTRIDLWIHAI